MVAAISERMGTRKVARVAVVDVEPGFTRLLATESRDVEFARVSPEANAIGRLLDDRPDAIVIARSVPFADVLALCRAVRAQPQLQHTPLAVFSFRHGGAEEVQVLEAGADDYVGTAISPPSILARLRMLMRRGARAVAPAELDEIIRIGRLAVRADSYCVHLDGRQIDLTAGEFRLLWRLAIHAGKTLTVSQLGDALAGGRDAPSEQSIRSRVHALRRKLGSASGQIQTIKNAGYRLVP
ncbi:MAG: response regulator transcription factor [Tepidisphaeraceae bacterium]